MFSLPNVRPKEPHLETLNPPALINSNLDGITSTVHSSGLVNFFYCRGNNPISNNLIWQDFLWYAGSNKKAVNSSDDTFILK